MAIALALVGVSPADNPDKLTFEATFSGDYGTQTEGDQLNLAPYDVDNNPTGWTNPENIPTPELPVGLDQNVSVLAEDIGGYYVNPHPTVPSAGATNGVANTLNTKTGCFLRMYAPGGAELATNAAYAAGVTGGSVLLEMVLPKNQ